jgi:prophage antirepressor-like protein
MNDIAIFDNPQFGSIRTMIIDGKPYFSGSDVATALGYTNVWDAIKRHCKGVVKHEGVSITPNQYGKMTEQVVEMSFIPESDIYRLVMRSNLQKAVEFQDWVVEEVLPSIRKTGGYVADDDKFIETYLPGADPLVKNLFKSTLMAMRDQTEQIKALKPKAEFYDAVADAKNAISFSEAARLLGVKGIGQNNLFRTLRDCGILMNNNLPYQEFMDRGYFRVIEQTYEKGDGTLMTSSKTLIEQRGLDYIRKVLIFTM